MSECRILRGVSGSGKSKRAKQLIKEWVAARPWAGIPGDIGLVLERTTIICSADQFFVNPDSGKYEFDAKKLSLAHARCKTRAETAMELGVGLVIIDNTHTRHWEYKPYVELAERFGYEVKIEMVGQLDDSNLKVYANRNSHGVPLEAVRKMAARFEK